MLEAWLKYEGNGRFTAAARQDHEAIEAEFSHGETLHAKVMRPRSVRQNNFLHALIRDAYDNQQPDSSGPRLASWKHLKSYLLIRAGRCDTFHIPISKKLTAKEAFLEVGLIARAIRSMHETVWITYSRRRSEMTISVAGSLRFDGPDALDSEEASKLVDKVIAIIRDEYLPGTTAEELLEEARRKAA